MNAAKFICSNVVSNVLTVSKNGIRHASAIRFRSNEQIRLVAINTTATITPIHNPLINEVAIAMEGSRPNKKKAGGVGVATTVV